MWDGECVLCEFSLCTLDSSFRPDMVEHVRAGSSIICCRPRQLWRVERRPCRATQLCYKSPQTYNIDRPKSTLFLLLSWPTFLLSGKCGILQIEENLISQWIIVLSLVLKKNIEFKFPHEDCMKKVEQTKTNLQKYFRPSSLNHVQRWEPKKVTVLKEDDRLCLSRSYYSM